MVADVTGRPEEWAATAHGRGDHSGCGEHTPCFLEWNGIRLRRMDLQREMREGVNRHRASTGFGSPVPSSRDSPDIPVGTFRVGNKNARNVYRRADGYDVHIGCVFDPAGGPSLVAALNFFLSHEVIGVPPEVYRVDPVNPRNVFRHVDGYDVHVGCVFDPADGPLVVAALNAYLERGE